MQAVRSDSDVWEVEAAVVRLAHVLRGEVIVVPRSRVRVAVQQVGAPAADRDPEAVVAIACWHVLQQPQRHVVRRHVDRALVAAEAAVGGREQREWADVGPAHARVPGHRGVVVPRHERGVLVDRAGGLSDHRSARARRSHRTVDEERERAGTCRPMRGSPVGTGGIGRLRQDALAGRDRDIAMRWQREESPRRLRNVQLHAWQRHLLDDTEARSSGPGALRLVGPLASRRRHQGEK